MAETPDKSAGPQNSQAKFEIVSEEAEISRVRYKNVSEIQERPTNFIKRNFLNGSKTGIQELFRMEILLTLKNYLRL
jgi:hypothetical protein